jgi:hypothetical protein
MKALWRIGQSLWKREYPAFYEATRGFGWTEPNSKLVQFLTGLLNLSFLFDLSTYLNRNC